ncbi:putative histone-like transcription factor protein-1 [Elsinoe australis]|uniref:Putative histone-like transcription factor protein-1 n=1 Tax=Elsinoe australis TaxID=40998 RepID=A0A4U7AT86_9PEZI|nr:putative histone-like transcription factor protein-1 [Elsinoe australis]
MPYNNNPIPPSKEVTGTVTLPLARTKKILSADDELCSVSNNAAFAITIATEQFLQYLVEQTHNVVKAERKPRRNIQYRDVANAVARHDNLEFLTDVVPRTMTYKAHKEKKTKERENAFKEQQERRASSGPVAAPGESALGLQTPAPAEEQREERPDVMDIDAVAGSPEQRMNGITNGGHV